MSFRRSAARLVALAACCGLALLAGCTSKADNKPAQVRYLNLLDDQTAVGVSLDGKPVATGVGYQSASSYHETRSNNYAALITNAAGATLSSYTEALGQLRYTIYLYGTAADIKRINADDSKLTLPNDKFTLRLLVASAALTGYDLYVTTADADLATTTPNLVLSLPATISTYGTLLDPGSYRVRITPTGTKTVVFDRTLSFTAKSHPTFVVHGTAGAPKFMQVGPDEGAAVVFADAV